MPLQLTGRDRALLDGRERDATALAMRMIVRMGEITGADRLVDITGAHVDGCLYHGRAGLDFALLLARGGGTVRVPTTLNVSSLDLLHPDLYRGDAQFAAEARRLMDAYTAMGCRPTWTCAPYQLPERPAFGDHLAWGESNAIVFANSVLGARTERYGDFSDICAALTGRVPETGLHLDENRRGRILLRVGRVRPELTRTDAFYAALGHIVGRRAGTAVPVIDGLPADASEDAVKTLGAAAASSGAVALFHAVGITPEAPSVDAAFGGSTPEETVDVTAADLRAVRDDLSTAGAGPLAAVSVGTPHASLSELERLAQLLSGVRVHPRVEFYASTGRGVLARAEEMGLDEVLEGAGVRIVTDTCTYVTPIIARRDGIAMTNSAKWAYYAPANLGIEVSFGTLEDCVRSAAAGRVVHDDALWADVPG